MLKSIVFLYEQLFHIKERDDLNLSQKFEMSIRLRMRIRCYLQQWVENTGEKPRIFQLIDRLSLDNAKNKCG